MDGVLERIDEDEEQKTDNSAITEGDEAEGAGEMRSQDTKENDNEADLDGDGDADGVVDVEGDAEGDVEGDAEGVEDVEGEGEGEEQAQIGDGMAAAASLGGESHEIENVYADQYLERTSPTVEESKDNREGNLDRLSAEDQQ